MARIPAGSKILTQEEALHYFPQWTAEDRAIARREIEWTGVTSFYVPPSGGYVGCHGGPNVSTHKDMPINGLVMYVGFLLVLPNIDDERIELSHSRGVMSRSSSARHKPSTPRTCPKCHLAVPQAADECDHCGVPVDR